MRRSNKGTNHTIRIRKTTPDHARSKAFEDRHHKVKRGHCKHRKEMFEVGYES